MAGPRSGAPEVFSWLYARATPEDLRIAPVDAFGDPSLVIVYRLGATTKDGVTPADTRSILPSPRPRAP